MNYCKKCGTKLENDDPFCGKCGTKLNSPTKKTSKNKANSNASVSSPNKHVLPAILSFFFPALGQFIKGQVIWGLIIWFWFIAGNILLFGVFGWSGIILVIIFNIVMWIYQIYDAYNAPEKEPKDDYTKYLAKPGLRKFK